MQARALGVIAVAGLAVVGFAIFWLAGTREPKRDRAAKAGHTEEQERQGKAILRKAFKRPTSPVSEGESEAEDEAPEPTLDDARKEFETYIADLDREAARLDKSGGTLTQEEWVKHRTRGAAVLDSVLRRLDHTDPNMIVEIKEMQEATRTRLDELKPPGG